MSCLQRWLQCGGGDDPNATSAEYTRAGMWPSLSEPLPTVVGIDALKETNRKHHRTDNFTDTRLIVRRGAKFSLKIYLSSPVAKNQPCQLQLQFRIGQNRSTQRNGDIYLEFGMQSDTKSSDNGWDGRLDSVEGSSLYVSVTPSHEALVGTYSLSVHLSATGGPNATHSTLPEAVVVLFNPMNKHDQVFAENKAALEEYIFEESGVIFSGNKDRIQPRSWNYGQFEAPVLRVALHLLTNSYLKGGERGNAVSVVRALSAMVNSNDADRGVLVGKWQNPYDDGVSPSAWGGSVEICAKFIANGQPVRYGQCWVFAGTLCSVLRALGIPTRVVTNFESGHDTNRSNTIDAYLDVDGRMADEEENDSVWNYHVWNETWMKRPDMPHGYDGWQVVDATPQERSRGVYRTGPASVAAVREGVVGLDFDTAFVFAEVNGDRVVWQVEGDGSKTVLRVDKHAIGHSVSTKAIGSADRLDLTAFYKHAEGGSYAMTTFLVFGSKEERDAAMRAIQAGEHRDNMRILGDNTAQRLSVSLRVAQDPPIGSKVELTVEMLSDYKERVTVALSVSIRAVFYTGKVASKVFDGRAEFKVERAKKKLITVNVEPKSYLAESLHSGCEVALKCFARCIVLKSNEVAFATKTVDFAKPTISIQLRPSKPKVGEAVEVRLRVENPLPVDLSGAAFHFEGLADSNEGAHEWRIKYAV